MLVKLAGFFAFLKGLPLICAIVKRFDQFVLRHNQDRTFLQVEKAVDQVEDFKNEKEENEALKKMVDSIHDLD